MKSKIFVLIVLVILLFALMGLFGAFNSASLPTIPNHPVPPTDTVACTMEAKMCPDGSYVGRTGPHCEFAACPAGNPVIDKTTFEARIGMSGSVYDVSITPVEILEDSRCPTDVVCIQAGTVRVRATVVVDGASTIKDFKLNDALTIGNNLVELVEVKPTKQSTVEVNKSSYRFIFRVIKNEPKKVMLQ